MSRNPFRNLFGRLRFHGKSPRTEAQAIREDYERRKAADNRRNAEVEANALAAERELAVLRHELMKHRGR